MMGKNKSILPKKLLIGRYLQFGSLIYTLIFAGLLVLNYEQMFGENSLKEYQNLALVSIQLRWGLIPFEFLFSSKF